MGPIVLVQRPGTSDDHRIVGRNRAVARDEFKSLTRHRRNQWARTKSSQASSQSHGMMRIAKYPNSSSDGPRNKGDSRSQYDEFTQAGSSWTSGGRGRPKAEGGDARQSPPQDASRPCGKKRSAVVGWWNGSKWVKFGRFEYANSAFDVTLPPSWPTDPAVGAGP
jgi:hypothetical protein